jgi:hypothetical protein
VPSSSRAMWRRAGPSNRHSWPFAKTKFHPTPVCETSAEAPNYIAIGDASAPGSVDSEICTLRCRSTAPSTKTIHRPWLDGIRAPGVTLPTRFSGQRVLLPQEAGDEAPAAHEPSRLPHAKRAQHVSPRDSETLARRQLAEDDAVPRQELLRDAVGDLVGQAPLRLGPLEERPPALRDAAAVTRCAHRLQRALALAPSVRAAAETRRRRRGHARPGPIGPLRGPRAVSDRSSRNRAPRHRSASSVSLEASEVDASGVPVPRTATRSQPRSRR